MVNQEHLKAYLGIIQGLLSCPQGEEWIFLRQYQDLVNPELVEVMEEVAHHLSVNGDIKAGKYLHNWASKLHHILIEKVPLPQKNQDKTQVYLEFIQALLDCGDDCSESEIIEANADLIDPGLIKMMRHIASKLSAEGDHSSAEYLYETAADLRAVWLSKHQFEPTLKPEIAADPWLDEEPQAPKPSPTVEEAKSLENLSSKKVETSEVLTAPETQVLPSIKPQVRKEPQLDQQLQVISDSLAQLAATLSDRKPDPNPLWYMDVLEKAIANNWILSTDEVERLIGIKPHCHHDEEAYQRGCWLFRKAGKIGAQIGWKVEKYLGSSLSNDKD